MKLKVSKNPFTQIKSEPVKSDKDFQKMMNHMETMRKIDDEDGLQRSRKNLLPQPKKEIDDN